MAPCAPGCVSPGVGVDNIDIPVATKHGVVVMNTPAGNTISTAEHAFTLMMSLARHIPQGHQSVVEGRFKEGRKAYKGVELYNKTLAILGMGRIGGEFARRAMGFGMRVLAYDPYLAASKAKPKPFSSSLPSVTPATCGTP
ncbi:MAG: hypothetical protein EBS68_16170 [Rhodobacteraceae bacterium]|nr:hypothetical protein [Paracoccaceae bacterium]